MNKMKIYFFYFFDLLHQNFNLNESFQDLKILISETKLTKYFQSHNYDSNFIIQIIWYKISATESNGIQIHDNNPQMELSRFQLSIGSFQKVENIKFHVTTFSNSYEGL